MSSTPAATRFVFHIAVESDWQSAKGVGSYRMSTREPELLDVPVVIENLEGGDEGLPHIYGSALD